MALLRPTFVRRMGACEEALVAGTVPDALVSFCHLIYAVNKTIGFYKG